MSKLAYFIKKLIYFILKILVWKDNFEEKSN